MPFLSRSHLVGREAIGGRGGPAAISHPFSNQAGSYMRTYFFGCIHKLITRFPRLVVFLSFLIAAGAGMYGVNNMEMITDQDRLLSEDLEYHSRYIEFMDKFGDLEFLYVVIEGNEKDEMVSFADTLAARLRRSPDVQNVIYEFHTNWVKDYALLYSSQDDLAELQTELRAQKEDIHSLFETRSIDEILREINDKLKTPQETLEGDSSDFRAQLQTLLDALDGQPNPDFAQFSKLEERIREQDKTEYMWSDRGNLLLMFVLPAKDYTTLSVIERPLQRIREDIWLTEQEIPTVKAGLTGRPALQADEMSTTNADMLRASLIALVGVTLLFSLFFRELIRPVFAVLALLAALGWTYGFVAFTLGHLNLLSLVFALVLIGLGVDFGI
ncbi:MMPL family transporter, partial [bacterium]|nr:MMPL family transporter [bacterium]